MTYILLLAAMYILSIAICKLSLQYHRRRHFPECHCDENLFEKRLLGLDLLALYFKALLVNAKLKSIPQETREAWTRTIHDEYIDLKHSRGSPVEDLSVLLIPVINLVHLCGFFEENCPGYREEYAKLKFRARAKGKTLQAYRDELMHEKAIQVLGENEKLASILAELEAHDVHDPVYNMGPLSLYAPQPKGLHFIFRELKSWVWPTPVF